MSTTPDSNDGEADDPSNVLLLASSVGEREATACGELLGSADPGQSHVILATGLQSPAQRLAEWDAHVGARPAETTVVDVSLSTRSTAAAAAGDDLWPGVTVERVTDGDLLDLGTTLDSAVERSDRETLLCVHSVSDLLQSAGRGDVFRFLEVLTRTVDRAGGVAHYHLDPDLHDEELVRTFEVLFDTVVDLRDGDGTSDRT